MRISNNSCRRWFLASMLSWLPGLALAHGLLLDAESNGDTIFGSAYYSNGEKAVNESVALLDLSVPGASPVNAKTDVAGDFTFKSVPAHRYRVIVYGDEGHSVEVELVAASAAKPKLIESAAQPTTAFWPPPAWLVIGAALLLTLIPVVASRNRVKRRE